MKFSIKDFFSKCNQIRKNLRIWPHLTKKSLMKNFIFCAVLYHICLMDQEHFQIYLISFIMTFFPLSEILLFKSSHSDIFWRKGTLKICSKITGEHTYRSVILIKLQSNFIEITLRHGCSPVNLLHIFGTPFPRNTSEWLLLTFHDSAVDRTKLKKNFS